MDAFFAPYLFPRETYFIGGLVVLIIGLLGWRWVRVSKLPKEENPDRDFE